MYFSLNVVSTTMLTSNACREFCVMHVDVPIGEYEVAEVAHGSMGFKVSRSGRRCHRVTEIMFM